MKKRELIVTLFKLSYVFLLFLTLVGGYLFYQETSLGITIQEFGKDAGELAILVYGLTIIPGIFRRFGWRHKLVSLLMIFRRYIGLFMFFLIVFHYTMQRGVAVVKNHLGFFQLSTYEVMGMIAFLSLLLLAVTSNDISTKKLGSWWARIHALTYGILWFIFLHVALQKAFTWSLFIGGMGVVQVSSFLYKWNKNRTITATVKP